MQNQQLVLSPEFGDVISTYTREQALLDGVLVDVGPMAREVGFRWPTALTLAVWSDCVVWRESDSDAQGHQDEMGRLWDVVFMASRAARKETSGTQLHFQLRRVPRDGHSREAALVTLKLVVGPGDNAEPVMTIMMPYED